MSESSSTRSCCISSSSSCPTPDSSESSWWLLGVLTRLPLVGRTFDDEPLEPEMFGPPLVLLLLLPIPLEPLPELGLRKLVLSKRQTEYTLNFHVAYRFQFPPRPAAHIIHKTVRNRPEMTNKFGAKRRSRKQSLNEPWKEERPCSKIKKKLSSTDGKPGGAKSSTYNKRDPKGVLLLRIRITLG